MSIPRVLSIAGSDSSGGAGIQADLKTMCALGCYGMTAITSVTCQDTRGVHGAHDLPPEFVANQITHVLDDIGADAIKIGMLSNAGIIEAVAFALEARPGIPVVLDPVMVAKSGDALFRDDAREALISLLLPLATLVTPNAPEATALSGVDILDDETAHDAARQIFAQGAKAVLIKGGHRPGIEVRDLLLTADGFERVYAHERILTNNTHGTGCTLSAAIACYLALGHGLPEAIELAGDYLHGAIKNALPLGHGHGPLNHGWQA
jgi:hydroxymethylpyrimidine/phosphomethylpyrimidine kinase